MIRFLKNAFHLATAILACFYYGFPARKLKVIGVTGTSGKTTTTHLIFRILKKNSLPVSMLSTIKAQIGEKDFDTGFHVTTPSPWQLQKFLSLAAREGSRYFVLEITSHALDQYRVWGIPLEVAVITNITHEHLDYHGNLKNYCSAKARILRGAGYAILNRDDLNFKYLETKSSARIISFGMKSTADVNPANTPLRMNFGGEFNLYNGLASMAVAKALNLSLNKSLSAVNNFSGLPGRLEEVETKRNLRIFIDFAHKPDALEAVLKTLKGTSPKRLIAVFGCAGLRDRLKRPSMGEIAGKYADFTILTAEDPRTEDVRDINEAISKGLIKAGAKEVKRGNFPFVLSSKSRLFIRIPDRQEAINFTIGKLAREGDTLVFCGKGHEKSMCYGVTEYPWDEKQAILKALR
jgi:UDP-N-acetylmuramoyl-L-alanyl-D-glutamate--2,6-diaminopimelate ligase